jgi:hypothetical protein
VGTLLPLQWLAIKADWCGKADTLRQPIGGLVA